MNAPQQPDHLALARATKIDMGEGNIITTDNQFWHWSDKGVWTRVADREMKQKVQLFLERRNLRVMKTLVDSVTEVLKTETFIANHQWNAAHNVINFTNGEVRWADGNWVFESHRRENYRTAQIPHAYDLAARCPRFEQYLNDVFRDDSDQEEKKTLILELMGYTLTSNAKMEVYAMLIGSGANGKSVLLEIIRGWLGL